ncbi:MAG: HlyD family secretion protein [Flavobacteriaceae bacterium]
MLNISKNPIENFKFDAYRSGQKVFEVSYFQEFNRFLLVFSAVLVVMLFLPWTQNISGKGYVTTLQPDKRPQTVQSPIPGKIDAWYVREGDLVQKGDTLLKISEIKSDYFDPLLVERTQQQLTAKKKAVLAYEDKVAALSAQLDALKRERKLKGNQVVNKQQQQLFYVQSDSIKLEAAITNRDIAKVRLERTQSLFEQGLKATKDLEEKKLKFRETEAKLLGATNNYRNAQNEVQIATYEIDRIQASFGDKISKTRSELATAKSMQYEAEAAVAKLQNAVANYNSRTALQYVTAPQSGFINKALKGGIGETFKAGEQLLSIMPDNYQMAVETYVRPIDMPLVQLGEKVRVEFDGWPAIVFSGWPNVSYGTYGARVVAIENYISDNQLYRVLLAPDPQDHPWPEQVRMGSGARTIALLNDVPVWYEIWRQLNGFPPEYYRPKNLNRETSDSSKTN